MSSGGIAPAGEARLVRRKANRGLEVPRQVGTSSAALRRTWGLAAASIESEKLVAHIARDDNGPRKGAAVLWLLVLLGAHKIGGVVAACRVENSGLRLFGVAWGTQNRGEKWRVFARTCTGFGLWIGCLHSPCVLSLPPLCGRPLPLSCVSSPSRISAIAPPMCVVLSLLCARS